MRYWDELATYERDGFTVIVDKSWEDIPLNHLFDDSIDPDTGLPYYDIEDMARKIDRGDLDYFILRARAMVRGFELGEHIVGGFLYEDAREVLTDGIAEDLIWEAVREAKGAVKELADEFARLAMTVDEETAAN
jgi:hypothetical protein